MGVWDSMDGEVAQTGRRKYVCVTGNWSLLGSWLVRNLLDKGYNVRSTLRTTVGKNLPLHPSQSLTIAFLSTFSVISMLFLYDTASIVEAMMLKRHCLSAIAMFS